LPPPSQTCSRRVCDNGRFASSRQPSTKRGEATVKRRDRVRPTAIPDSELGPAEKEFCLTRLRRLVTGEAKGTLTTLDSIRGYLLVRPGDTTTIAQTVWFGIYENPHPNGYPNGFVKCLECDGRISFTAAHVSVVAYYPDDTRVRPIANFCTCDCMVAWARRT
jgi:hypothetical protein